MTNDTDEPFPISQLTSSESGTTISSSAAGFLPTLFLFLPRPLPRPLPPLAELPGPSPDCLLWARAASFLRFLRSIARSASPPPSSICSFCNRKDRGLDFKQIRRFEIGTSPYLDLLVLQEKGQGFGSGKIRRLEIGTEPDRTLTASGLERFRLSSKASQLQPIVAQLNPLVLG